MQGVFIYDAQIIGAPEQSMSMRFEFLDAKKKKRLHVSIVNVDLLEASWLVTCGTLKRALDGLDGYSYPTHGKDVLKIFMIEDNVIRFSAEGMYSDIHVDSLEVLEELHDERYDQED